MTALKSLVNGVESWHVSVEDRGLLYGHSVFETVAVKAGVPLCFSAHLDRLERSASKLGIPVSRPQIEKESVQLCAEQDSCVLRITITIGVGGRGYATPADPSPTRILTLHDRPRANELLNGGIRVGVSSYRIGSVPMLAGHKHGNRLEQIVIRDSWQPGWQEALVFDQAGALIEATQANVFVRYGDTVITPRIDNAGVAGIIRGLILSQKARLPFAIDEDVVDVAALANADEVVITNSIIGAQSVSSIEGDNPVLNKTFNANEFKLKDMLIPFLEQHGAI